MVSSGTGDSDDTEDNKTLLSENELIELLLEGLRLLEKDYLGGSGSRGYGQIKLGVLERTDFSKADKWKGEKMSNLEL